MFFGPKNLSFCDLETTSLCVPVPVLVIFTEEPPSAVETLKVVVLGVEIT